MKTIYSGTTEYTYKTAETISYSWRFEDAEDHEHPFILTVTVGDHTHSEGHEHDIGDAEVLAAAYKLAREIDATAQAKS